MHYQIYFSKPLKTKSIMLGNLDNEVFFKKAFTNKIVFKAFVRDILGIEIEIDKIETEKKFAPKIGYIDFELDIFAESIDKRICIEIQRVELLHFVYYLPKTSIKNRLAILTNLSSPRFKTI